MGIEIEHKFLVSSDAWRAHVRYSQALRQGYLSNNPQASVRIRIAGEQANLNIKGMTRGIQRPEYEYAIPLTEAEAMLMQLCARPLIEKVRHYVTFAGKTWEIDEFTGDNQGLLVAELELNRVDEVFTRPDWIGADVSAVVRYYNVSLLNYPYTQWTEQEQRGLDLGATPV